MISNSFLRDVNAPLLESNIGQIEGDGHFKSEWEMNIELCQGDEQCAGDKQCQGEGMCGGDKQQCEEDERCKVSEQ